jgi:Protein of unknown function (DUF1091)
MWKSLGILALMQCVTPKLRFEAKVVVNPKIYGDFKFNVSRETLNMSMNILRTMEGKIMVSHTSVVFELCKRNLEFQWKFEVYRIISNNTRQKYFNAPKVNYCNMRREAKSMPFLSAIQEHIDRYGNWSSYCPYKPGYYGIWNLPMDEHMFPMKNLIPKGRYEAANNLIDENQKPEMILKFNMFIEVF